MALGVRKSPLHTHQRKKPTCKQTTSIPGAYWWLTARYSTVAELIMQFGALLFVCTAVNHLATSGILRGKYCS